MWMFGAVYIACVELIVKFAGHLNSRGFAGGEMWEISVGMFSDWVCAILGWWGGFWIFGG